MPEKVVATQEGSVTLTTEPTVAVPAMDVAYSSPYQERLAREAEAAAAVEASPVRSFRGPDWSDLPNYYCPLCKYATLDGDLAVIAHGASRHPGVDLKEHISG